MFFGFLFPGPQFLFPGPWFLFAESQHQNILLNLYSKNKTESVLNSPKNGQNFVTTLTVSSQNSGVDHALIYDFFY